MSDLFNHHVDPPASHWWRDGLIRESLLVAVGLTVAVVTSLSHGLHDERHQTETMAIQAARANFQKDLAFRQWATRHGGVYVPADLRTPPNPYLSHVPERDITTPSGKRLTLMNPAYMLRQIMSEYPGLYGIRGRITSLQPLNPNNAADPWEQQALKSFEAGVEEALEFIEIDGVPQLRLMRPMVTLPGCLKCHAQQGYQEGDIRGGIGVRVPMEPFLAVEQNDRNNLLITHGLFWMVGIGLLGGYFRVAYQRRSDRRRAQAAMEEREARFRTLAEIAPVGVFRATAQGDYLYVNDQWCSIAGVPAHEAMGAGWMRTLANEDRDRIAQQWQAAIVNKRPFRAEFRMRAPDGRLTWVLGQATPQWAHLERVDAWIGAITDISELKYLQERLGLAKEEAEAATRAKSNFLAVMSHEIRTPMNVVMGMGEVLSETNLTPEQQHYVEMLQRSGASLLTIINDILHFSHLEAGQLTFNLTAVDPCLLVSETVTQLQVSAENKGLQLNVDLGHLLPPRVVWDQERVRQVLVNLIGNAIKFTTHGEVRVRLEQDPEQAGHLRCAVMDTGIGIAQEHQESIFGMFTQADAGINRRFGGTGLGLAIARSLVTSMGGRLWVESQPGRGSIFTFSLPAPLAEANGPEPTSLLPTNPPIDQPLTILLVEDSPDNQLLIRTYLKNHPYQLEIASDGAEALRKVWTRSFDLVLMDIQMPVMDGFAATRAIRTQEAAEGRPRLPILALTAHAQQDNIEACRAAGCDGHLAKPVKKSELLNRIEELTRAG